MTTSQRRPNVHLMGNPAVRKTFQPTETTFSRQQMQTYCTGHASTPRGVREPVCPKEKRKEPLLVIRALHITVGVQYCTMQYYWCYCCKRVQAGLPVGYTLGVRCHLCWQGPILNPRPVLDSSAQTTRGMLLDFLL